MPSSEDLCFAEVIESLGPARGPSCSIRELFDDPHVWRANFCENSRVFCDHLKRHGLPPIPCRKSPQQTQEDFKRSALPRNDVEALFPKDAMHRLKAMIPVGVEAVSEVLRTGKWHAPESIIQKLQGSRLIDPNDPSTPAEDILQLNELCQLKLPVPEGAEGEAKAEKLRKANRILRATADSEADDSRAHLELGPQAAVLPDGRIFVCPGSLRLATEAPPEAFLSILLHEIGHIAGPCQIGADLVTEAAVRSPAGSDASRCALDPDLVEKIPGATERLNYLHELHQQMECMEEANLSNPGTSGPRVGRLRDNLSRDMDQAMETLVSDFNAVGEPAPETASTSPDDTVSDTAPSPPNPCLFSQEQLRKPSKKRPYSGLMRTCTLQGAKLQLLITNMLIAALDEDYSALQRKVRNLRIQLLAALPNENQFGEVHADALAADALPLMMEKLETRGLIGGRSDEDRLLGLLQAPATFCTLETRGLLRGRYDHGPEEDRVATLQNSAPLRKALGCGRDRKNDGLDRCLLKSK